MQLQKRITILLLLSGGLLGAIDVVRVARERLAPRPVAAVQPVR